MTAVRLVGAVAAAAAAYFVMAAAPTVPDVVPPSPVVSTR